MDIKTFVSERVDFVHDSFFKWTWRTNLFLILSTLVVLIYYWQRLPPFTPLYYSLPWGEEQLASPYLFFVLIFSIIFIIVFNSLVAFFCFKVATFISRILLLGSVLASILMMMTIIHILLLVI